MKAKLIVEGKEFLIEIHDPELKKLLKPHQNTGYEKIQDSKYFYSCSDGSICSAYDRGDPAAKDDYDNADYYSDETVANNNIRADKLMRRLRRFSVEHRDKKLDWENSAQGKWCIIYEHNDRGLTVECNSCYHYFGTVFFDTSDAANLAIETFRDELIWYFTEYKDSL